MWPRVAELLLGLWLAISPSVLSGVESGSFLTLNAFACAAVVVVASCLAFWRQTRHSRGLTLVIAFWMLANAYWLGGIPASAQVQNQFLVGLLLVMFAIVPNQASEPPEPWRPLVRGMADPRGEEDQFLARWKL